MMMTGNLIASGFFIRAPILDATTDEPISPTAVLFARIASRRSTRARERRD
jgi:hypothetical protein